MKRSLLKTMLVVASMAVGTSGAWAVDYVTIAENANDATKQDVTYSFHDSNRVNAAGVTIDNTQEPAATVYTGSEYMNLYSCTTEGLERIALNAAQGTAMKDNAWWWRTDNSGKPEQYGLQYRQKSTSVTVYGGIAVLNLKAGNTVTITGLSLDAEEFAFPGASSIDGTEQEPVKEAGEADYTVTRTGTTEISINVTADGYIASYVKGENYTYIHDIIITETKPMAAIPTGEITKVNGTKRIVSLSTTTLDGKIYYTTDETVPVAGKSNLYDASKGIEISETTTIKAITVADGVSSNVFAETFEAGTEIALVVPVYNITEMTDIDGVFYPSFSFNSDNSGVLCSPVAQLTATLNSESVDGFDGTYAFGGNGTLVVTASAEGYASSSVSVSTEGYMVCKVSNDYSKVSKDNIGDILGDGWTIDDNSTRWSSWSKTLGIDTDLTPNGGDKYYTASHGSSEANVDFVTFGGDTKLLFGYGIGTNDKTGRTISIKDAIEGSLAEYATSVYGKDGKAFVDYATSNTLAYSIPRSSTTIKGAVYYVPSSTAAYVKAIPASGYASFSAPVNVTVPAGVAVYKAVVADDAQSVVLTKVETEVIPANTGVLLYSDEAGEKTFAMTAGAAAADFAGNALIATSVEAQATVPAEGTFYALKANAAEFAPIQNGVVLSADKAYLPAPASSAKTLNIVFGGDLTGISDATSAVAEQDGAFYTVQGVKVENPVKGLYIHNGKKVIIK